MGKHWYNKVYSSTRGFRQFSSDFFQGVGIGSDYLRYPVHKFRQGVDFLDKTIQHGSKVPLLNDTLSLLADSPEYAELLGIIHTADKTLEDVGNLAYDLSNAIAPSPLTGNKTNFRYQHQFYGTPYDEGFRAASSAAGISEPQITGARPFDAGFIRPVPSISNTASGVGGQGDIGPSTTGQPTGGSGDTIHFATDDMLPSRPDTTQSPIYTGFGDDPYFRPSGRPVTRSVS